MESELKLLAKEAEKELENKVDFSDNTLLAKACLGVLKKLDRFRIGPRVLILLAVFGFAEEKRERLWKELHRVVRESN